jgi:hypothetical protein
MFLDLFQVGGHLSFCGTLNLKSCSHRDCETKLNCLPTHIRFFFIYFRAFVSKTARPKLDIKKRGEIRRKKQGGPENGGRAFGLC